MKARNISKFLICVAVLVCPVFASPRTLAASTTQFKLLNGYVIVIPVTVNGAGPYEFVLDTGSNTTLIGAEFARELRLRPLDRVELVSVTGLQIVPRTQLESLSVGSRTAKNLEAVFSDLREVRSIRPNIRGVLGMNFLARFNFLIDYIARRIEFEEEDELENRLRGERLPLASDDARASISLYGAENSRLILDSGTPILILFNADARRLRFKFEQGELRSLIASSDPGIRIAQEKRLRVFNIGGVNFYDLPVALIESKTSRDGRIEDGLLPTSLFQRVYFNHRKKFVTLNPR